MAGYERSKGILTGAAVVVAFAALIAPALTATASAAPLTPATGSAPQQWAYGGENWANGTLIVGNSEYQYSAFFGWTVVFSATNTSATTRAYEANRTVAADLSVQGCSPTCANPSSQGTYSFGARQSDVGFANFTNTASVFENGTAVPAVGLLNASSASHGNLSETLTVSSAGHLLDAQTWTTHVVASGNSSASVQFAPQALGLVPLDASSGAQWNASAAFFATGAWNLNYAWTASGSNGTQLSGHGNPNGSVNATGMVALEGFDLGWIGLRDHEQTPVILLAVHGPFDAVDGMILVPRGFDLFANGSHPWGAAAPAASITAERLDASVGAGGYLHVSAASADFSAQPAGLGPGAGAPGGLSTDVGNGLGLSPMSVQAQPMSVPQAQGVANCLDTSCAATAGGGTASAASPVRSFAGYFVIGALVVGAAVGVLGWRAVARRRPPVPPANGGATVEAPGASLPPGAYGSPEGAPPRN